MKIKLLAPLLVPRPLWVLSISRKNFNLGVGSSSLWLSWVTFGKSLNVLRFSEWGSGTCFSSSLSPLSSKWLPGPSATVGVEGLKCERDYLRSSPGPAKSIGSCLSPGKRRAASTQNKGHLQISLFRGEVCWKGVILDKDLETFLPRENHTCPVGV